MRLFALITILFLLVPARASAQPGTAHLIIVDGTINPASRDYIHDEILRAAASRAECLIIELNTPGGLLKSTRAIVSDLLTAPLPVIVYVAPSGAQAASAGVFVTLAAHLAFMAPGTNIGAAHPVAIGETPDSIMAEKTTNDAAAFIRTISEKRHRNVRWAEDAVRKSLSITETEALKEGVIDSIATNPDEVLRLADGRHVTIENRDWIVKTRGAAILAFEKTPQQRILDILSDPNIAYILMMLGIYGMLFELYNPGSLLPGIVGFISLVLAFYSLHTLPINYAGLALILFAIILFVLEIKIVSHGLLTLGGITSLVLGSIMLFQRNSSLEFFAVSWQIILGVAGFTAAFFIFALGMGIRAQSRLPSTGMQGMIGESGKAISDLSPDGHVRVHGEIWSAKSIEGVIVKGSSVRVDQIDNLTVHVRKTEE